MRKLQLPKRLAYSVEEAAHMLGVHVETIRREIRAGKLSAKRMNRKFLIPADSLNDYINAKPRSKKEAPRE